MNLSERKIRIRFFSGKNNLYDVNDLRVIINIKRSITNSGNSMNLTIFNLNKRNIDFIINSVKMEIYAGYGSHLFLAFVGVPNLIKTAHKDADYTISITAFDGNDILSASRSSYTGYENVTVREIIETAAHDAGLGLKIVDGLGRRSWKHGYSFYGSSKNMLEDACKAEGLEYSVQNNVVQVTKKGQPFPKPEVLLSMETGLIRYVEVASKGPKASVFTKGINPTDNPYVKQIVSSDEPVEGLTVYSLMRPDLIPGDPVVIKHPGIVKKRYHVSTIEHDGNNMPVDNKELGTWTSTITLVE
ncbi:Hypothetical protein GbCGDNIH6_1562 [Granulibacter bethesdensis]|uniref:hypothetical protein n=1 Tax=Granulibacter bethesdensis TaxID=364410 RepID=UPI00090C365F|nr:hypothetical protein [Granulibacter bethesdensis]APH57383.1 Hypothetical protein GbCGDNIH6_1562 [Granulibacter bethesdensis]